MLKIGPIRMSCGHCAPSVRCSPRNVHHTFALSVRMRHFRVVTPTTASIRVTCACCVTKQSNMQVGRHTLCGETTMTGSCSISPRSEEHTSELQSLMRIPYAVFCLNKKKNTKNKHSNNILI